MDELARRSSVVNSGGAFGGTGNEHLSIWSYNDRNELTGSARREGKDPGNPVDPVDDEQFAYDYDPTLDMPANTSRAGRQSDRARGRHAGGDDTDHVRLWETATGKLLARLPSPTWCWSSAHFHPSGKILATCGADGVVRVWDLATGTPMYSFEGVHVTTGQSLSFSQAAG